MQNGGLFWRFLAHSGSSWPIPYFSTTGFWKGTYVLGKSKVYLNFGLRFHRGEIIYDTRSQRKTRKNLCLSVSYR